MGLNFYDYEGFQPKITPPNISAGSVAIAEFFWKMQRKTWYSILGLEAMPLSLKNLLLIHCGVSSFICKRLVVVKKGIIHILLRQGRGGWGQKNGNFC